jgi:hypothetical protein
MGKAEAEVSWMDILFIGGPQDGLVLPVDDSLEDGAVISWPTADRTSGSDEEVAEYVLRDGTAQYAGHDQDHRRRRERKKQLRSPV